MAGVRSVQTSVETVRKWHSLAVRRRRHFVELHRSERWRRYYTEEAFLAQLRDVVQTAEGWEKVLQQTAGAVLSPRPN
jgi:uncharacterized repeat protein (TIGR03809 family)